MFLFTNAPVGTGAAAASGRAAVGNTPGADGAVIAAIRDGAQSTGVGFDYLLATARRESGLDPAAKAATSSASGLFQFIEQTWLGVMKTTGAKLGLSPYADAITARADGSYTVADPAARQAILDLRRDPRVASALAGALTQRNREALGAALGREPTSGDLYAAHVLGAKGAASLIASAQGSPARAAARDLPEAAAANRNLFYDKAGRARSSSELYALLSTATAGTQAAAPASLPEMTTAYASLEDGLRSLFRTDKPQGSLHSGLGSPQGSSSQGSSGQGASGAVSPGVAKLWQGRTGSIEATGAARSGPSYFPRSDSAQGADGGAALAPASADPAAASAEPIIVPLPPRRPAAFGTPGARMAARADLTPVAAAEPHVAQVSAEAPLQVAPPARAANLLDLFSSYLLRNGP